MARKTSKTTATSPAAAKETKPQVNSQGNATPVRQRRPKVESYASLQWRIVVPLVLLMALAGGASYLLIIGTTPNFSERERQIFGIGVGVVSALMTATSFLLINATSRRAGRITNTLNQLRVGQNTVRTEMRPRDELGRVAKAVDQYADYVQEKRDEMRVAMRKSRREVAHLNAVIEAMNEGVIVQDNDGRVLLMNEYARNLLGAPRRARQNAMNELTALVTDQLGPMLSPNLYALGDEEQIELDGKLLRAQAAAILGDDEVRVGTVLMLRDATEEICRDRDREVMLKRLERNIQQPMMSLARDALNAGGMTNTADFARELTRHAFTLQKMIVELRDLGETTPEVLKQTQKPIQLEVLIWGVSNEWRQIAHACQITMKVMIQARGLYVLGDDRRLRWAIGNLVDNAIKYTAPGGTVTLEIRGEENGAAQLRIRDNGVGIAKHDQPMLFTRFWRGMPRTAEGRAVRVPGMGQGLYLAKQIIEAHGGKIEIRSRQNVGTAVYFSLPTTASEGFQLPFFDSDMDGETTTLESADEYFSLDAKELSAIYKPIEVPVDRSTEPTWTRRPSYPNEEANGSNGNGYYSNGSNGQNGHQTNGHRTNGNGTYSNGHTDSASYTTTTNGTATNGNGLNGHHDD
jgi:signal transduction histidine kinase